MPLHHRRRPFRAFAGWGGGGGTGIVLKRPSNPRGMECRVGVGVPPVDSVGVVPEDESFRPPLQADFGCELPARPPALASVIPAKDAPRKNLCYGDVDPPRVDARGHARAHLRDLFWIWMWT